MMVTAAIMTRPNPQPISIEDSSLLFDLQADASSDGLAHVTNSEAGQVLGRCPFAR